MVTAMNLIKDLFKLLGEPPLPNSSHRRESEKSNGNIGGRNPKHCHAEGILGLFSLSFVECTSKARSNSVGLISD